MKLPSLLSDSREMLQIAGERLIESPKPTVYVSAYTFAVGISSFMDWFSEALPKIAIFAGIVGVLVLARLNHKKGKLTDIETLLKDKQLEAARYEVETAQHAAENAHIKNRMLREEMRQMGVELRRDEDKKL